MTERKNWRCDMSAAIELADIVQRLKTLETQNRRMKLAGLVLAVMAVTSVLMAQAAPVPESIEAQKFVLKNSSGQPRAVLSMATDGPLLTFLTEKGERQL